MTGTRLPENESDVFVELVGCLLSTDLGNEGLVWMLQSLRFNHMARLLHCHVAAFSNHKTRETCLSLINNLSEQAADRILRSPAVCGAIRIRENSDTIQELLEAELTLGAEDGLGYRDSWSALGNVWLGKKPPAGSFPLEERQGRFYAPELECGIPIDLSLPLHFGRPSAGLQAPQFPESSEILRATTMLDGAVRLLKEVTPVGHSVLINLTSNIVLREDSRRVSESWGASSGLVIGRTVIVNPGIARGAPMLAELLLHEATHTALDCVELEQPLIPEMDIASALVISPWTGNSITLHAFVHASVVWLVLLNFWSCYRKANRDSEEARKRCEYIFRGFDGANLPRYLEPFRASKSNYGREVIVNAWRLAAKLN